MDSIWTKTVDLPKFPALQGEVKTDVLIIGGGMAGLYLQANEAAIRTYEKLAKYIACDFERKNNYVYSVNDRRKLEKEMKALENLGFPVVLSECVNLPLDTVGAVGFENQAQFHPLKFVAGLAKHLDIYEQTYVKELKLHRAVTERGDIVFDKVIIATHFPMDNKHGMYFLKLYQHRSYAIAYEGAANVEGMYVDEAMNGMSFRNAGKLLLVGGGDHRTGKQGGCWKEIETFAGWTYPGAKEVTR